MKFYYTTTGCFFYHQNDFKAVILRYKYCIIKIYFVGN